MTDIKSAAAYIRVSDSRQDEYSPESQLKLIKKFASENSYEIKDEYVFFDDGISAKSALKRNEFLRMISLAEDKSHPFCAIIVWKYSRFARNQEESIIYKSILKRKNVEVISVSEPKADGPFGSFVERSIEWFDEYYLTRLSGEVRRGMREKASRGEPCVPPPFGYEKKGKHYSPSDDSIYVYDIFDSFAKGEDIIHIANRLKDSGVKTKKGNPPDRRFIRYILSNPVYIGYLRYTADGKIMTFKGAHDRIIEPELFEKVQNLLKKNKRFQRKESAFENDYFLKGIFKCPECDSNLIRISEKTLQCSKYAKGKCSFSQSISEKTLKDALLDSVNDCLGNVRFIIETQDVNQTDYNEKAIKSKEKRLLKIKEAYLSGADSLSEYKKYKSEIENELLTLKNNAPGESVNIKIEVGIQDFLLSDVPVKDKNALLKCFIEKAVYEKDSGTLRLFFC